MIMEFIRFTWAHDGKEHIINKAAIAYVSQAAQGSGAILHLFDGETALQTVEPYDVVRYNLLARAMVPVPDQPTGSVSIGPIFG